MYCIKYFSSIILKKNHKKQVFLDYVKYKSILAIWVGSDMGWVWVGSGMGRDIYTMNKWVINGLMGQFGSDHL